MPLCVLAFRFKRIPSAQYALGLATAGLPLYVQPLVANYVLEHGFASPSDVLAGRFVGATVYAFTAIRMFGAAVNSTPKGADIDVSTWIAFATASTDTRFDAEGKPIRPRSGAIVRRFCELFLRMAAITVISSLSHPYGSYPTTAYVGRNGMGPVANAAAGVIDHVCVSRARFELMPHPPHASLSRLHKPTLA